jgi:hypothetical protein
LPIKQSQSTSDTLALTALSSKLSESRRKYKDAYLEAKRKNDLLKSNLDALLVEFK